MYAANPISSMFSDHGLYAAHVDAVRSDLRQLHVGEIAGHVGQQVGRRVADLVDDLAQRDPERDFDRRCNGYPVGEAVPAAWRDAALAEKLKIEKPDLKVLYMSGYTDNSIIHHGMPDEGIHLLAHLDGL